MTLKDLAIEESARITKTGGNGELRQHFLDMGVIPGTLITKIKLAPMGDPIEFDVNGYELTMRLDDAGKLEVEKDEKWAIGLALWQCLIAWLCAWVTFLIASLVL